ncbi:MAG: TlpA disulfide reductase family protein [Bacteroidota bacterium]
MIHFRRLSEKRFRFGFLTGILFGIGALFAYGTFATQAPETNLTGMKVVDLDGQRIALDDLRGKPVLINFFATWCGPCIEEMPDLVEMQEKSATEGWTILLVSDEPVSTIQAFSDKRNWPLHYAHLPYPMSRYEVGSIPTTYLLNAEGEIVYSRTGPAPWGGDRFMNKLRALL